MNLHGPLAFPVFMKSQTAIFCILVLFLVFPLFSQTKNQPSSAFNYGVAWYPEHWDSSLWQKDLDHMKSLHINVVRVGEFAWSRMQPSEKEFDFAWLRKALDLAHKNGIQVVLGTPTASPPIWLTTQYKEVSRIEENGSIAPHGYRGHFNPASEKYLEFCRVIARKLGEEFGHHPAVIGWQIDNEYWPFSYDPETRAKFQNWLKVKYKTIDNLNRMWGTVYWSEEYFDWSQIPLLTKGQNPSQILEINRFKSHIIGIYQDNQVKELGKTILPTQWITTNFHGEFQHCDAGVLGQSLDFLSFDPYVGSGHLDISDMGFRLDRMRGFKPKTFWIMETQPGHVNWAGLNNSLDPGETRRMVWHQIAHGADAILYWQWRSCNGGQEQYHGSIVGQSGNLKPIAKEIGQIGSEIQGKLLNTLPKSKVAIWFTMDDQWALTEQKHHKDYHPVAVAKLWYSAFRAWGVDVDVISNAQDLKNYALVLAPCRYVLSETDTKEIKEACGSGTHILLGARSGRKDIYNGLLEDYQPGLGLHQLLGAVVEEYYALEKPASVSGEVSGAINIWGEMLTLTNKETQVLATYKNHSWLNDKPAMVMNKVGKGALGYISFLPEKTFARDVAGYFLKRRLPEFSLSQPLPEGIEKSTRSLGRKKYTFYINHGKQMQQIGTEPGKDLISGRAISGQTPIQPDEVIVSESDL